ncbi:MAG: hypothetical protein L3J97_00125 [Thermoplasmata archaeon]|nr:hypothetical protein [Thermoplasmata archaeon]
MHRVERQGWAIALVVVGCVFGLSGPAQLVATASAATVPSAGSAVLWAYGNDGSSHATAYLNGGYEARSTYFGWHVVLTQTNLTATTFQLEIVRTMGFTVYASFCNPDCAHPLATANITARAWERSVGFANFSSVGSVVLNGSSVPAIALIDEHALTSGNLTETLTGTIHRILGLPTTATGFVSIHDAATIAVVFSPALGLFPLHLAAGDVWSATSAFTASGAWDGAYVASRTGFNGTPVSAVRTFAGNASGSGNVSLLGAYAGDVQLDDGETPSIVHLTLHGPFDAREGVLLLPAGSDLFATAGHDWSNVQASQETAGTSALDLALQGVGHFGLLASSTDYSGAASNPNDPGTAPAVVSGFVPAAAPSGAQLQGQPETVNQAQHASTCLIGGACPPAASPPVRNPVIGLVSGVAAVAALVAAVGFVAARRRPVRPKKSRSSQKYPTSASHSAPASATPAAKPDPSELDPATDPLGRLW